MKKYIVLLFIFISSLCLTGCDFLGRHKEMTDMERILDRGYLLVGVKTDSKPFGFYDKDGNLAGIDIEIAHEIANNIFKTSSRENAQFIPVTTGSKISKLNSKEVDILVATMSINDKRKLVIDFSMPYFLSNQKLMVRNDSSIKSLTYFNSNGKLAVILGSTAEKILRLVAPNAYVVGAKTYFDAKKLLEGYEVDGIFGDDCLLSGLNDGQFRMINRAYSREYYGVAIRKSDESKELLEIVNKTIAELIDSRKLNTIKKQFINKTPKIEQKDEEIYAELLGDI